jgi:hypothetical protein
MPGKRPDRSRGEGTIPCLWVRRLAGVTLEPGEAAVFKPDGKGGFRYNGVLDQDDLIR